MIERRQRPRLRAIAAALLCLSLPLWLAACATSPTGRSQLQLLSEPQLAEMGEQAYTQMREQEQINTDPGTNRYVSCVANAIVEVVGPPIGGGSWDVTVFENEAANAFALPGGNIGVFTGLLDVAQTPDQLAAVIGHEIAHVLASHSNERVSQQMVTQVGLDVVNQIAGGPGVGRQLGMAALGLGAQVGVLLPYGRIQESEADQIGQELMARAGFDPRAAVALWRNMQQAGGNAPPEFLSTHPSGESRIQQLEVLSDDAMTLYRQAQSQGRKPNCRR